MFDAARFREKLAGAGITQAELARRVGVTQQTIGNLAAGNSAGTKHLHKIARELGTTPSYLMGETEDPAGHAPPAPRTDDDTAEIIQLDLSLSMGPGTLIEEFPEEEPVRMSLAFIRAITRTPSNQLRMVRGIGDSMEPTLRTGDRVLVDLNERALARSHGVYWVDHLGTHGLKRLRAVSRSKLLIMSDNPLVPDFEADADDVRIVGRAVWFARDL